MFLLIFTQAASQNAASADKWFTAPIVAAALITSVFTVAGIAIRDYFFKILEERRSNRKTQQTIYERYSHPLVISAISLMNRLHEILCEKHRPVYLLGKGLPDGLSPGGAYRAYKKLSTIYRLAATLGWIRACRREFSYLRVAGPADGKGIDAAIEDFENALADGNWVEWDRIVRLAKLWQLCDSGPLERTPEALSVATQVDNLIWDSLEKAQVEDISFLDEAAKQALCRDVADCLTKHLQTNRVSESSMGASWPVAFEVLGMREAWIYRDWQSAIGDIMIQSIESDARKFEVIGFADFEEIILSSTARQSRAIQRLFEVFDSLDLSINEDRFDARPTQLRTLAKATAKLILAIGHSQGHQSIIPQHSKERAEKIAGMKWKLSNLS